MVLFPGPEYYVRLRVSCESQSVLETLEQIFISKDIEADTKLQNEEDETVILIYNFFSDFYFKDICNCPDPITWIKQLSEECDAIFSWIYEDRSPYPFKYGIYEYQHGKCINQKEESLNDILNRYNQEMRGLIIEEFQNMLFPHNIVFNKDLKSEILSFSPYFGMNMQHLIVLEKTWFDINTERMNGNAGNDWFKPQLNFAYVLFEKLRIKWQQVRNENLHILDRQKLLEKQFFESNLVSLIENITAFRMQRRAKCKYFGSMGGCRNGKKCDWSHNNPYLVPLCDYFDPLDESACMYGNKCYYRHSESDTEEADNDCFFDANVSKKRAVRIPAVPKPYFCFICKVRGDHWIMQCPLKRYV